MFKFFRNLFKKKNELREETRTIQAACECPAMSRVVALSMDLSDDQINSLFASYLRYVRSMEQVKPYKCVNEFIDRWHLIVDMSDVPSELTSTTNWCAIRATEAITKFRNQFVTRHCITSNEGLAEFINKI